ncbi:hypothetical protein [Vulcanisaeta sp. JCM 14467]
MYLLTELLEYAIAIEAIAVIAYGMIRGGIEVRRFIAVGAALILAYVLPTLLGLAPPGSPTYLVLYHDVEKAEEYWGLVFMATAKAGFAWAIGMTILNIIEAISSFGIGVLPLQEFEVLQSMGFIIDPIADVIFAVMHVSQVMIAVLHTIAYLAWFSYAIAPIVIGVAIILVVVDELVCLCFYSDGGWLFRVWWVFRVVYVIMCLFCLIYIFLFIVNYGYLINTYCLFFLFLVQLLNYLVKAYIRLPHYQAYGTFQFRK